MKTKSAQAQQIAQLKNTLGKKLFAIAVKTPSSASKKEVLEAVKACKGRKAISQAAAVDSILSVANLIFHGKMARNKARSGLNSYGHRINRPDFGFAPILGTHKSTISHSGAISYRLSKYKAARIRSIVSNFMPSLSGDVSCSINFATDYGTVAFSAGTSRGEQYSRKCTYCKTDGTWTATVQTGWNKTVQEKGLAMVDGLPTLAVLPIDSEVAGEEIYRAKWLEAARGFDARLVDGYLIRRQLDGRTYTAHSSSIASARAVITRQTPASIRAASAREQEQAERLEALKAKLAAKLESGHLNGYAQIPVTLSDSRAVGNCASGTRSWIARHMPGRTSATVAEIVQIPDEHPRVILACLHAIARQTNLS
jgi:hypothetical protein